MESLKYQRENLYLQVQVFIQVFQHFLRHSSRMWNIEGDPLVAAKHLRRMSLMDVYRKRVLEKLELIYVKYLESTCPISA